MKQLMVLSLFRVTISHARV